MQSFGYTELILDNIYGGLPDNACRTGPYLTTVNTSRADNKVLIFKIEAGQLTLSASEYSIKDVVHNCIWCGGATG